MFVPEGHDPDTWVQEIGAEAFREKIRDAMPLSQFLIGELSRQVNLGTLEGRAKLAALARPHLEKMRESPLRTLIVDELARLTRLNRADLESMVRRRSDDPATSDAAPAPRTVAEAGVAPSPVRRALRLLLEQPDLGERVDNLELLAQADVQGIDVLIEAIDFFQAHPSASVAQLLEFWKDTPKGRGIQKLLSQELGIDRVDGVEVRIETEFQDVIRLLTQRALKVDATRLLAESQHRELSRAELGVIEAYQRSRQNRPV